MQYDVADADEAQTEIPDEVPTETSDGVQDIPTTKLSGKAWRVLCACGNESAKTDKLQSFAAHATGAGRLTRRCTNESLLGQLRHKFT